MITASKRLWIIPFGIKHTVSIRFSLGFFGIFFGIKELRRVRRIRGYRPLAVVEVLEFEDDPSAFGQLAFVLVEQLMAELHCFPKRVAPRFRHPR